MTTAEQVRQEEREAFARQRKMERLQRAAAKARAAHRQTERREAARAAKDLRRQQEKARGEYERALTKAVRGHDPALWDRADRLMVRVLQLGYAAARLEREARNG